MHINQYKSLHDGAIFNDKNQYIAHLKKLAKQRLSDKKVKKSFQDSLLCMFDIDNLSALNAFLNENQDLFLNNPYAVYTNSSRLDPKYHVQISDISFELITVTDYCKPLKSLNTSKRLPGWSATLLVTYDPQYLFDSDIFKNSGININSGTRYNENSYQYSISLFAHDFKKIFAPFFMKQIPQATSLAEDIRSTLKIFNAMIEFPELGSLNLQILDKMNNYLEHLKEVSPHAKNTGFDDYFINFKKIHLEHKIKDQVPEESVVKKVKL